MHSMVWKLMLCLLAGAPALAQSAPAPALPAFDVASVRPSRPGGAQISNVPLDAGYVYGSVNARDTRNANGRSFSATHQAL